MTIVFERFLMYSNTCNAPILVFTGYAVWGNFNSVNYQVTLYLLSRIIAGAVNAHDDKDGNSKPRGYRLMCVVVWASVMYLFERKPEALQYGLKSSMEEVYRLDERVEGGLGLMSTKKPRN